MQDQYKSPEQAMAKSLEESGEKITQLSSSVAFYKEVFHDTRKAIASHWSKMMLSGTYRVPIYR